VNFEAMANEHKDAIYRQMLRVCGNREDAEDVLAEALLKAYRNLDQLSDSLAFRAWLAQIARRVCWQIRRREDLLPVMQLSDLEEGGFEPADGAPHPEAALAIMEMKAHLNFAIASLSEENRVVYQMRDVEELTGDEVCARLNITTAAMKSRLHRARTMLRERLDVAFTDFTNKGKCNDNGS
jgi:RNA polymerase sigma-70 factor, ECF subfamily